MSTTSVVNVNILGCTRVESSAFVNIPMIGLLPDAEEGGGRGVGQGSGGNRRCVGSGLLEFVAAALGYIFRQPRVAEAEAPYPADPADPAAYPPPQNGPPTM